MAPQLFSMEDLHLANKAVGIIKESFDRSITLSELSKRVNSSPRKLKLVFLQFYMGLTIREMQLYLRIEQAMTLLYMEKVPIDIVINQIGYKSVSSFNRAFQKVVQQTPEQWIKSLAQK